MLKKITEKSSCFSCLKSHSHPQKMNKEETDLNRYHCINIPLPLLSVSTISLQCFSPVNNEIDFCIISMFCFPGISSHDSGRIKTQGLSATYPELRMSKIVIPGVY